MAKLSYKVSYYALYVMLAVIVAVLALFYFGGAAEGSDVIASVDPDMWQPKQTDMLLYLVYLLLGLTVVITLLTSLVQFAIKLKDNPKEALKSLAGLIILVIVLIVAWSMGSDQALVIPGYDGTDNVPFWLKLTDMFLYTFYILFGVAILAVIGSSIKKLIH